MLGDIHTELFEQLRQFAVGFVLDVMGIEPKQFVKVVVGGTLVDIFGVEQFDHLFNGKDLLVTMAPAKAHKKVK